MEKIVSEVVTGNFEELKPVTKFFISGFMPCIEHLN